jgi:hypothetical protein
MLENTLQRRICGPKKNELKGGWRKAQNEELRYLYPSPIIIGIVLRRMSGWNNSANGEDDRVWVTGRRTRRN